MFEWRGFSAVSPLVISLLFLNFASAHFTPHFTRYLDAKYGKEARKVLERPDFGESGSFGGKKYEDDEVTKQPVIIVHGVTNVVGKFTFIRNYLEQRNYTSAEVYGTTYGDGPKTFIVFARMECQYIRQVRVLVQSVAEYTSSKVDVLAYSMGSPIARKAILGGNCGEGPGLGPPLTHLVDVFVSIAGANFGSFLCFIPIAICNSNNGLHCTSKALASLNDKPRKYEGDCSYTIFSMADNKVGTDCCDRNCSALPHADGEFVFAKGDHDEIMRSSLDLQFSLITRSNPSDGCAIAR